MRPHEVISRVRQVDVGEALRVLPLLKFADSGGTNGWLADPALLMPFVAGLGLPGRLLLVNCRMLPPWQGIPPHVDLPFGHSGIERRFHVPLKTDPRVTMRWPDAGVEEHLEVGWLYEVRFDGLHEIIHRADAERVHIQMNVVQS